MGILRIATVFIVFYMVVCTTSAQENEKGFTLVKADGNILIYERWTTFPKTNPPVSAREVKGIFYVDAAIPDAIALVQNEAKIKEWQKHVAEFKVYLKDYDTTGWEEYSYHDIPWPVSDQDHFLVYEVADESTPERIKITFESKVNNKLAPERDGVNRMKLSGSWLFEKADDGKVKVTYSILSMPSSIPRIFTDPVIRNNMLSTIKGYIEILESKN